IIEGHFIFGMMLELILPVIGLLVIGTITVLFVLIKKSMALYDRFIKQKMQIYFLLILTFAITTCLLSVFLLLEILITTTILIIGTLICLILVNYFEPQIFTKFWSYFAIVSIYIIKNDGRTLFSYDFVKKTKEESLSIETFLIGGFIYAITHGIEEITKIKTPIKLIDLEKIKLAFFFGEHSFSILFTREINDQIYEKLKGFMTEFENNFATIITEWDGRIELLSEGVPIKDKLGLQKNLGIHEILNKYFKI
ncbi:MAG: hypothetical protein ACFFD2_22590, partial [Promethearchaeota archaeon]